MPINVRNMTAFNLYTMTSPNGKVLPKSIAQKFKRTNVLQLLRIDPEEIVNWHPVQLENYSVTGLTLTERRALYHHLKPVIVHWGGEDPMTKRKRDWYEKMKSNFKERLNAYQCHVKNYGPHDNHKGCPLIGLQCPINADKVIDYYAEDYGYPTTEGGGPYHHQHNHHDQQQHQNNDANNNNNGIVSLSSSSSSFIRKTDVPGKVRSGDGGGAGGGREDRGALFVAIQGRQKQQQQKRNKAVATGKLNMDKFAALGNFIGTVTQDMEIEKNPSLVRKNRT